MPATHTIFYDGICNMCDSIVSRLIAIDKQSRFRFIALQSDEGQDVLKQYIPLGTDSIILSINNSYFIKSTAILKIFKLLGGIWLLPYYFLVIIPKPIRDMMYDFIAKNRYKLFGTKQVCILKTEKTV